MISFIISAAVGYVVGAFTPAVGRQIKALFVKKSAAVVAAVPAAVVADVKAAAAVVTTKI